MPALQLCCASAIKDVSHTTIKFNNNGDQIQIQRPHGKKPQQIDTHHGLSMVQRVVVGHGSATGEQAATETATRKVIKGRRDAIEAIKARLLRCSEHGRRRRFKRGYLAAGCGGDAADSAIFYLACLSVCIAATTPSLLGSD